MSVTVTSSKIFNNFLNDDFQKALLHGHSFTANPLGCSVALKSLELFKTENTLGKIKNIETKHNEQIENLHQHPLAEKPRVMGSILAFNLPTNESYKSKQSEQLRNWYIDNHLNIRPLGSTIYLMPPYCITDKQLSHAYKKLFEGLDQLEK